MAQARSRTSKRKGFAGSIDFSCTKSLPAGSKGAFFARRRLIGGVASLDERLASLVDDNDAEAGRHTGFGVRIEFGDVRGFDLDDGVIDHALIGLNIYIFDDDLIDLSVIVKLGLGFTDG